MAVDYSKIAFTSDFRYERLLFKGSVSFSSGDYGNKSFAHNLGYIPYVVAFANYPGDKLAPVSNIGDRPDLDIEIVVYNDTTTLEFECFDGTFTDRTVTVYYRIYGEGIET